MLAVVILAVIAGVIVRYNGPVSVARDFLRNLGATTNTAAVNQICSDNQQLRQGLTGASEAQSINTTTIDTSKLTFTLSQESLSRAVVSYAGTATVSNSATGNSQSGTLTGTVTLESSGIWWCVETYTLT